MKPIYKFARLLIAFAGAVWGMRAAALWVMQGTGVIFACGVLLVVALCVALAMVVNEELHRDVIDTSIAEHERHSTEQANAARHH